MRFRLTYAGPLRSGQDKSEANKKYLSHKHDIRKIFDRQLRRLWSITEHLGSGKSPDAGRVFTDETIADVDWSPKKLAQKHGHSGWSFIPLVTRELKMFCEIDMVFLRPGHAGGVIRAGDIDNRLKTLFDCMKIPDKNENYREFSENTEAERQLYCLLEDDDLITKVGVETDELLQPVDRKSSRPADADVRLLITVHIRPYVVTFDTASFL